MHRDCVMYSVNLNLGKCCSDVICCIHSTHCLSQICTYTLLLSVSTVKHCCVLHFRQGQYVNGIHEYFSTFEYVLHWSSYHISYLSMSTVFPSPDTDLVLCGLSLSVADYHFQIPTSSLMSPSRISSASCQWQSDVTHNTIQCIYMRQNLTGSWCKLP